MTRLQKKSWPRDFRLKKSQDPVMTGVHKKSWPRDFRFKKSHDPVTTGVQKNVDKVRFYGSMDPRKVKNQLNDDFF